MSCPSAKRAYTTPTQALTALQGMRKRRQKKGAKESHGSVGIEVYRCPLCQAWHHGRGITHPQPKPRRAQ